MASAKMTEALAEANQQIEAAEAYKTVLANIKTLSSPTTVSADIIAIADAIFEASLGVVSTRSVISDLIATLKSLDNYDLCISVGNHVVGTIGSSTALSSSLLEQSATLRELIATAYEAQEEFAAAAKTLAEIPLDTPQRKVADAEKAAIWIRIVRNYLEDEDATSAEIFLNKLKNVMHDISDAELNLHFKLSSARIQDGNRQFLAAAQSYHEISVSSVIAEEERLHTLSMAIKCAILAPAGPPRSRVLGRIYKDERSQGLEEFSMLEKMFLDRLLAPEEVKKFAKGLAPHQLATTSDGSTVLEKAVIEHNLLGASRLYTNIGFESLGHLLGLDADKAEDTTAKMMEQGRVGGWIDQIEQTIWFDTTAVGEAEKSHRHVDGTVGKGLRRWDANVQALAEEVEHVTNALQVEFPEFVMAEITA